MRPRKENVMTAKSGVTTPETLASTPAEMVRVYSEGITAGLVGAATIAAWFFLLDAVRGHPFFTPTVLGTALLHGERDPAVLAALKPSFEVVLTFTWLHVLAFLLIGVAASRLLALAEREPSMGFGLLILFVVFQFGFMAVCFLVAEPLMHALAWPEILVGNLLAAGAMVATFRRRHPGLTIEP
jgi:hypothetical protein